MNPSAPPMSPSFLNWWIWIVNSHLYTLPFLPRASLITVKQERNPQGLMHHEHIVFFFGFFNHQASVMSSFVSDGESRRASRIHRGARWATMTGWWFFFPKHVSLLILLRMASTHAAPLARWSTADLKLNWHHDTHGNHGEGAIWVHDWSTQMPSPALSRRSPNLKGEVEQMFEYMFRQEELYAEGREPPGTPVNFIFSCNEKPERERAFGFLSGLQLSSVIFN